jgi:hypothetical protein
VLGVVEVLGGVFVFRRIAASHLAANHTQTEMHPAIAHFEAFLAALFIRVAELDLIEMGTGLRHVESSLLYVSFCENCPLIHIRGSTS